tara:strand:- start:509 stop:745 length:237 start_codon:yes stop_codon:yes gene_type:complete
MKISTKQAKTLILNSKGKFMTIGGLKNNGEQRVYKSSKFNAIMHSKYINIWEKANGYRNVNPANINYLKAGGVEYKVA